MPDGYNKLLLSLDDLDDLKISPSGTTIFFKHISTFLAFKQMKDSLRLEFFSDTKINSELIENI
jgi:hypothetical protein